MKKLISVVFLSLAAQLASAAPVNLVQNGDFEIPGANPGLVPGWSYSGGDSYFGIDADYIGSPLARPGLVFYDGAATNAGLLAQSVATTNNPTDNFAAISFGGLTVFSQEDVDGDWTHFVINGLIGGPGATTLLQFANWNTNDFNQLDNVSLVELDDTTDVPEPATPLTLAAALAAITLVRRRRSS